jgi:hypothetical protein
VNGRYLILPIPTRSENAFHPTTKSRSPREVLLYGTRNLEGQHQLRFSEHPNRSVSGDSQRRPAVSVVEKSDLSPVNYKRVAEKDGKEVPWDQIIKGYEYEKGKYVVLKEEDFQRVDVEATQTVDIQDFVDLNEIDPIYFYKPYYLEPQKGGDKAYALLRNSLEQRKKGRHRQGGH